MPARNRAARWSLVVGVLALATLPMAVAVTEAHDRLRLVHAGFAVPLAGALGITALRLARRGRLRHERTIGRAGGEGVARAGRITGWLALYLTLIGAIAMGVYALEYFVLG